jgi:hypothetical protein
MVHFSADPKSRKWGTTHPDPSPGTARVWRRPVKVFSSYVKNLLFKVRCLHC